MYTIFSHFHRHSSRSLRRSRPETCRRGLLRLGEDQSHRRDLWQQLSILLCGRAVQGEPLPLLQQIGGRIMDPNPTSSTSNSKDSPKRSTSREGLHLYQVLGVNKDASESEIRKVGGCVGVGATQMNQPSFSRRATTAKRCNSTQTNSTADPILRHHRHRPPWSASPS